MFIYFPEDSRLAAALESVCPWCDDNAAAEEREAQMVSLGVFHLGRCQAHKPPLPRSVLDHIGNFLLPAQEAKVRMYRERCLEITLWGAACTTSPFWTLEMCSRRPEYATRGPFAYVTSVHLCYPIIFEYLYGKTSCSASLHWGTHPYCYRFAGRLRYVPL